LKRKRFHYERNDVWLRDCQAFLDRKRRILIGKFAKLIGQEGLAANRRMAFKTNSDRTPRLKTAFSTISLRRRANLVLKCRLIASVRKAHVTIHGIAGEV
jgi:hypothetical protein